MKKLFLAITLLSIMSCSNQEDETQEIIEQCECLKQEYNVTMTYYDTRVVKVGEPYKTCEESTRDTVVPYDPNYKTPGIGDPQITIKAYKVTCPNDN